MFYLIYYIISIFVTLFLLLFLSLYLIFSIYANFKGGMYVPTKQKEIDFILQNANLKKEQVFLDLGSGDGRVVRTAVKKYKVKGIGIEINPILFVLSIILSKAQKLTNIKFIRENLFNTDIKKADVIYTFLMPETLKKLKQKFENERQKKVLIISHGFIIEDWKNYLVKKIDHQPFPTYYYFLKPDKT